MRYTDSYDVVVLGRGAAAFASSRLFEDYKVNYLTIDCSESEEVSRLETISHSAISLLRKIGVSLIKSRLEDSGGNNLSVWAGKVGCRSHFENPSGASFVINKNEFWMNLFGENVGQHCVAKIVSIASEKSGYRLNLVAKNSPYSIHSRSILDASGMCSFSRLNRVLGQTLFYKGVVKTFVYPSYRWPFENNCSVTISGRNCWFHALKGRETFQVSFFGNSHSFLPGKGPKSLSLERFIVDNNFSSLLSLSHVKPLFEYVSPVYSRCLKSYYIGNYFMAGSSLETYDPLSSSGIFNALASGLKVADALVSQVRFGTKISHNLNRSRLLHYSEYLKKRYSYYAAGSRFHGTQFWSKEADIDLLSNKLVAFKS